VDEEFRELLMTLLLDFNDMAVTEPDRFNGWQKVTIAGCIDRLRALKK
jgi:hypothetical protein